MKKVYCIFYSFYDDAVLISIHETEEDAIKTLAAEASLLSYDTNDYM